MAVQLALLDRTPVWKISEETREIGRKGLASARAALHSVPRRTYDDGHHLDAEPTVAASGAPSAPVVALRLPLLDESTRAAVDESNLAAPGLFDVPSAAHPPAA